MNKKKPAKKSAKKPVKKSTKKVIKKPVKNIVVAPVLDSSGVVMITPLDNDVIVS